MGVDELIGIKAKNNLRAVGKSVTMRQVAATGVTPIVAIRRPKDKDRDDDSVFDDFDALVGLAQASFKKAAQKAVAENDRLGIPTHGAENGKLVVRQPSKAQTFDQH